MLFDKILGNSDIINNNWKKEINKWLVFIKNKGELKRFIHRLTKRVFLQIVIMRILVGYYLLILTQQVEKKYININFF